MVDIPKKKHAHSMRLKGIMISSSAVPVSPAPELEESGSDFGDDDYNQLPVGVSGAK